MATAHGFAWYLQLSASALWSFHFLFVGVDITICREALSWYTDAAPSRQGNGGSAYSYSYYGYYSRYTSYFLGFGIAAACAAALGLALHIPALLNAERALNARRSRRDARAAGQQLLRATATATTPPSAVAISPQQLLRFAQVAGGPEVHAAVGTPAYGAAAPAHSACPGGAAAGDSGSNAV